jgi:hypothetical protein
MIAIEWIDPASLVLLGGLVLVAAVIGARCVRVARSRRPRNLP